jgi:hypothetical protein
MFCLASQNHAKVQTMVTDSIRVKVVVRLNEHTVSTLRLKERCSALAHPTYVGIGGKRRFGVGARAEQQELSSNALMA